MQLCRHTIRKRVLRRSYASVFVLIMLCALGSQAFHHTHSHNGTSHLVPAEHMYAPGGDLDCAQMVSCHHSHDSKMPGFFMDESNHYVLFPLETVTLIPMTQVAQAVDPEDLRFDLRTLSVQFPPPKHS